MNKQLLLIFYIVLGLLCSFSRLLDGNIAVYMEWFSKPLLMPVLFLYFKKWTSNYQLLGMGLLFAWFGDLFLMIAGDQFILFLLGLLSFLVMQVIYIVNYRRLSAKEIRIQKQSYLFFIPIIGLGLFFYQMMYPNLDSILKIAVGIYAFALVMMNITALSRWKRTPTISFYLVSLGALLFMISDMMIGYGKFVHSFPASGFWIMLTYFIGQLMIIEGVIRHPSIQDVE